MITKKISLVLMLSLLTFLAQASEYVLYSPEVNKGGDVGRDGSWEIVDDCAASHSFLEQD